MDFKKIKCNNCGKVYDSEEHICPNCIKEGYQKPNKGFGNRYFVTPIWKQATLFGIGFLGFQIFALFLQLIIELVNLRNFQTSEELAVFMNSVKVSAAINFTSYFVVLIALLLVLNKDNLRITNCFKDWKVFVGAVIGVAAIYAFNIFYGLILQVLGVDVSSNDNQSQLEYIIAYYPLLSTLVFGIIGPICEELTYRVGLYTLTRRINKYVGFAITIVVFTLIHFDYLSENIVNELLNIPYYAFAAFTFTFLYEKLGFGASVVSHSINNLISVFTTIIVNSLK